MKNYGVIAVVACIAFVTLAAVPGQGQVLFKGNVPFDFCVGRGVLPAGEYSIGWIGWSSQSLALSSGVRWVEIMTPLTTESRTDFETPKLVFHRYGNEYFLAEIWTSNDNAVRKLADHPRERQLAMAGLSPQVAVVYDASPSTAGN
ncbi:MAG TPA: hypothetical protein VFI95_20640 [Terriglobales bacterium]|nr:hypothetical protein [Terriglobales bacterium]